MPREHSLTAWLVMRERSAYGIRYDVDGDLVLVKASSKTEPPSVPAGCILTRVKVVVPDDVLHPPLPEPQTVVVTRNQAEIEVSETC